MNKKEMTVYFNPSKQEDVKLTVVGKNLILKLANANTNGQYIVNIEKLSLFLSENSYIFDGKK
jgi:hypothetical protein